MEWRKVCSVGGASRARVGTKLKETGMFCTRQRKGPGRVDRECKGPSGGWGLLTKNFGEARRMQRGWRGGGRE